MNLNIQRGDQIWTGVTISNGIQASSSSMMPIAITLTGNSHINAKRAVDRRLTDLTIDSVRTINCDGQGVYAPVRRVPERLRANTTTERSAPRRRAIRKILVGIPPRARATAGRAEVSATDATGIPTYGSGRRRRSCITDRPRTTGGAPGPSVGTAAAPSGARDRHADP